MNLPLAASSRETQSSQRPWVLPSRALTLYYGCPEMPRLKLRPDQNIEYIITDSESAVPNDRVRAMALWEGWFGYDQKKYAAMLREAFEPFELIVAEPVPQQDPRVIRAG